MDLTGHGFGTFFVQNPVAIDDGDGQDGGFGFYGTAETAAVEFAHDVAVFAPGALGKDQIIAALFQFLRHILDDRERLPNVISIHGEGVGAADDFLN